jgi:hypothetical protein
MAGKPNNAGDADSRTRIFRLDKQGQRRGVDDVIDRLRQPDGWAWWAERMRDFPPASGADSTQAELPHLTRAKETHKAAMLSHATGPERTAATALYYACVAAALAHHGKRLTRQRPEALKEAFLDLATSTPEPWSTVMKKAAER